MSKLKHIIGESFINIRKGMEGHDHGDGIQCHGPYDVQNYEKCIYKYDPYGYTDYLVEYCHFDNSGVENPDDADEAISVVWGANATIRNCYIKNWGKAILIAGGDEPRHMSEKMVVTIENCVFDGNSRRHPYVQGGATVHMKNCVIKNWGRTFLKKSGGSRVDGGHLYISDCIFWQDKFIQSNFKNLLLDCCYQVESLRTLKNFFTPGPTRGIYAINDGVIESLSNCYKNKWWISLGTKNENPMSKLVAMAKMLSSMSYHVPQTPEDAAKYKAIYTDRFDVS